MPLPVCLHNLIYVVYNASHLATIKYYLLG